MEIIGKRKRFGSHLGLERIELVCSELDNPQNRLKFIHLAGTNGKGSTANMLARVLEESGLKVGLFTSPHLEQYQERFQINGAFINEADLQKFANQAETAIRRVESSHPELGPITEFELATAIGFLYFLDSQVDVVLLETGLGGRLDATNVVDPELVVITSLGYDHTDRLGTSLKEIAAEKGGIIKSGVPVVGGLLPASGENVLREIALQKKASWRSTRDAAWIPLGWGWPGGSLVFPGWGPIQIGLFGAHQLQNAATALLALDELNKLGWNISGAAVREGMSKAQLPGRMEMVSKDPFLLLDGAHNQEGLKALAQGLRHFQAELGLPAFTIVFGMLGSKEPKYMEPLFPAARRFVFTAADSGRLAPMAPGILKKYAVGRGLAADSFPDLSSALKNALETAPVCVCGSLYLVGAVKRYLRTQSVIM
ncbi:MAG: bifunctional folylpolyglutamate synthase/dihydrofolate synthase [Firmicutes bacterium]|nr:bifunctional folylpolyglutamate synthase/dihydrofolate synthase [Bacillota bacterium]